MKYSKSKQSKLVCTDISKDLSSLSVIDSDNTKEIEESNPILLGRLNRNRKYFESNIQIDNEDYNSNKLDTVKTLTSNDVSDSNEIEYNDIFTNRSKKLRSNSQIQSIKIIPNKLSLYDMNLKRTKNISLMNNNRSKNMLSEIKEYNNDSYKKKIEQKFDELEQKNNNIRLSPINDYKNRQKIKSHTELQLKSLEYGIINLNKSKNLDKRKEYLESRSKSNVNPINFQISQKNDKYKINGKDLINEKMDISNDSSSKLSSSNINNINFKKFKEDHNKDNTINISNITNNDNHNITNKYREFTSLFKINSSNKKFSHQHRKNDTSICTNKTINSLKSYNIDKIKNEDRETVKIKDSKKNHKILSDLKKNFNNISLNNESHEYNIINRKITFESKENNNENDNTLTFKEDYNNNCKISTNNYGVPLLNIGEKLLKGKLKQFKKKDMHRYNIQNETPKHEFNSIISSDFIKTLTNNDNIKNDYLMKNNTITNKCENNSNINENLHSIIKFKNDNIANDINTSTSADFFRRLILRLNNFLFKYSYLQITNKKEKDKDIRRLNFNSISSKSLNDIETKNNLFVINSNNSKYINFSNMIDDREDEKKNKFQTINTINSNPTSNCFSDKLDFEKNFSLNVFHEYPIIQFDLNQGKCLNQHIYNFSNVCEYLRLQNNEILVEIFNKLKLDIGDYEYLMENLEYNSVLVNKICIEILNFIKKNYIKIEIEQGYGVNHTTKYNGENNQITEFISALDYNDDMNSFKINSLSSTSRIGGEKKNELFTFNKKNNDSKEVSLLDINVNEKYILNENRNNIDELENLLINRYIEIKHNENVNDNNNYNLDNENDSNSNYLQSNKNENNINQEIDYNKKIEIKDKGGKVDLNLKKINHKNNSYYDNSSSEARKITFKDRMVRFKSSQLNNIFIHDQFADKYCDNEIKIKQLISNLNGYYDPDLSFTNNLFIVNSIRKIQIWWKKRMDFKLYIRLSIILIQSHIRKFITRKRLFSLLYKIESSLMLRRVISKIFNTKVFNAINQFPFLIASSKIQNFIRKVEPKSKKIVDFTKNLNFINGKLIDFSSQMKILFFKRLKLNNFIDKLCIIHMKHYQYKSFMKILLNSHLKNDFLKRSIQFDGFLNRLFISKFMDNLREKCFQELLKCCKLMTLFGFFYYYPNKSIVKFNQNKFQANLITHISKDKNNTVNPFIFNKHLYKFKSLVSILDDIITKKRIKSNHNDFTLNYVFNNFTFMKSFKKYHFINFLNILNRLNEKVQNDLIKNRLLKAIILKCEDNLINCLRKKSIQRWLYLSKKIGINNNLAQKLNFLLSIYRFKIKSNSYILKCKFKRFYDVTTTLVNKYLLKDYINARYNKKLCSKVICISKEIHLLIVKKKLFINQFLYILKTIFETKLLKWKNLIFKSLKQYDSSIVNTFKFEEKKVNFDSNELICISNKNIGNLDYRKKNNFMSNNKKSEEEIENLPINLNKLNCYFHHDNNSRISSVNNSVYSKKKVKNKNDNDKNNIKSLIDLAFKSKIKYILFFLNSNNEKVIKKNYFLRFKNIVSKSKNCDKLKSANSLFLHYRNTKLNSGFNKITFFEKCFVIWRLKGMLKKQKEDSYLEKILKGKEILNKIMTIKIMKYIKIIDEVSKKLFKINQERPSKLLNIANLQNVKNHILENRCLKFYFQKFKSNCRSINSNYKFKSLGCKLIGKLIKNKIDAKLRDVLDNMKNDSRKVLCNDIKRISKFSFSIIHINEENNASINNEFDNINRFKNPVKIISFNQFKNPSNENLDHQNRKIIKNYKLNKPRNDESIIEIEDKINDFEIIAALNHNYIDANVKQSNKISINSNNSNLFKRYCKLTMDNIKLEFKRRVLINFVYSIRISRINMFNKKIFLNKLVSIHDK